MAYQYTRIKWKEGMFEDPEACNGYINEHREVSAQKLNRNLKTGETVHHMDENKLNNDPSNLMVFRTIQDHSSHHSQLSNGHEPIVLINSDGSYSVTKMIQPEDYVCICGNSKDIGAIKCLSCHKIEVAKNIPSKEELEILIWQYPMTKLGQMFGVSDKAVSKWIKKYDLQKPPIGYWAQK